MSAALELDGVSVRLGRREALKGVSAKVHAGTFVAVCGPNGAGKTTLLRAALGLVPLASGRVRLGGEDPHRLSPERRAAEVAYLAQERRIAWGMPALQVAALGAASAPRAVAEARAMAALERVGMAEHAGRGVFELSGGERARVLLARLLATEAKVLVADEPIAGLDPEAQLLTLELLKAQTRRGATVVATLHDLALAARFADQVLVLCDGCLEADACFRDALCPEVLWRVFRLEAKWVDDPCGPLLAPCRRTSR